MHKVLTDSAKDNEATMRREHRIGSVSAALLETAGFEGGKWFPVELNTGRWMEGYMKLYRVTWIDPHEGTCYEWHPNAAAGKAALKDKKEGKHGPEVEYRLESENVPCDKRRAVQLCAWLNERFSRDNG